MSEDERGKMDKKSYPRQSSAVQRSSGSDTKKDTVSRNQRGKRRNGAGGSNYSYSDGQTRRPTPQKFKSAGDKRPKPRGEFSDRTRSDLEEDVEGAEFGSALYSGSKKGSLNHLLNFSYSQHDSVQGYQRGSWSRGRQVRYRSSYSHGGRSKFCYNKEQFLQANCQFVVKEAGDYSEHLMKPDGLVSWDAVEQVRVISTEMPSCPICLQYPAAGKMTRCGHIYCWACILHYLALGEKTWRKCPICYESIHSDDLKSVTIREVQNYKVGDTITMTLMKKEKGSIYAVPANLWQKRPAKCHNVRECDDVTRHLKLVTATPDQVLDVIDSERQALRMQLADCEPSEEVFIKGAQDQLKAREDALTSSSDIQKEVQKINKACKKKAPVTEALVETMKHVEGSQKKIKQYKSAFDNEEEEEAEKEDEEISADLTGSGDQTPQDQTTLQSDSGDSSSPTPSSPIPIGNQPSDQPLIDAMAGQKCDTPASPDEEVGSVIGSPEGSAPPIEMIPDAMPVEEAAEHLELPVAQTGPKTRHKSGDNSFYFYQADDGQHIYLHSLNARCLVSEYGSLENSPQKVTASIVEKESVFVTEELRKRLRYLSHLPLTCGFEVAEMDLKPPLVGKDTLKHFADDIDKRRRMRHRRNREDRRVAKHIEEQERKRLGLTSGTIIPSQFHQGQRQQRTVSERSDTRSDTSSPSLDTPVGSPLGLNVNAAEFHPSGTSPKEGDDGHQTSNVSFAQMLKAGTRAPVWPKKQSETSPVSPLSSRSAGDSDSDNNEDKVPVPEYQRSFGSAIEAAFETIQHRADGEKPAAPAPGGSGKKKKKQLVLFSTSMARGGK